MSLEHRFRLSCLLRPVCRGLSVDKLHLLVFREVGWVLGEPTLVLVPESPELLTAQDVPNANAQRDDPGDGFPINL